MGKVHLQRYVKEAGILLQTSIPKEIRDYQEKIIFGLSIRQLGFASLAVAVGIGSYFVLTHLLSVPLSIASYCIVAVCAPFMALGFIRIHGRTFEQHLLLVYRHRKRGTHPRLYARTLLPDLLEPDAVHEIPYHKPTSNLNRRRKYEAQQEAASVRKTE